MIKFQRHFTHHKMEMKIQANCVPKTMICLSLRLQIFFGASKVTICCYLKTHLPRYLWKTSHKAPALGAHFSKAIQLWSGAFWGSRLHFFNRLRVLEVLTALNKWYNDVVGTKFTIFNSFFWCIKFNFFYCKDQFGKQIFSG